MRGRVADQRKRVDLVGEAMGNPLIGILEQRIVEVLSHGMRSAVCCMARIQAPASLPRATITEVRSTYN